MERTLSDVLQTSESNKAVSSEGIVIDEVDKILLKYNSNKGRGRNESLKKHQKSNPKAITARYASEFRSSEEMFRPIEFMAKQRKNRPKHYSKKVTDNDIFGKKCDEEPTAISSPIKNISWLTPDVNGVISERESEGLNVEDDTDNVSKVIPFLPVEETTQAHERYSPQVFSVPIDKHNSKINNNFDGCYPPLTKINTDDNVPFDTGECSWFQENKARHDSSNNKTSELIDCKPYSSGNVATIYQHRGDVITSQINAFSTRPHIDNKETEHNTNRIFEKKHHVSFGNVHTNSVSPDFPDDIENIYLDTERNESKVASKQSQLKKSIQKLSKHKVYPSIENTATQSLVDLAMNYNVDSIALSGPKKQTKDSNFTESDTSTSCKIEPVHEKISTGKYNKQPAQLNKVRVKSKKQIKMKQITPQNGKISEKSNSKTLKNQKSYNNTTSTSSPTISTNLIVTPKKEKTKSEATQTAISAEIHQNSVNKSPLIPLFKNIDYMKKHLKIIEKENKQIKEMLPKNIDKMCHGNKNESPCSSTLEFSKEMDSLTKFLVCDDKEKVSAVTNASKHLSKTERQKVLVAEKLYKKMIEMKTTRLKLEAAEKTFFETKKRYARKKLIHKILKAAEDKQVKAQISESSVDDSDQNLENLYEQQSTNNDISEQTKHTDSNDKSLVPQTNAEVIESGCEPFNMLNMFKKEEGNIVPVCIKKKVKKKKRINVKPKKIKQVKQKSSSWLTSKQNGVEVEKDNSDDTHKTKSDDSHSETVYDPQTPTKQSIGNQTGGSLKTKKKLKSKDLKSNSVPSKNKNKNVVMVRPKNNRTKNVSEEYKVEQNEDNVQHLITDEFVNCESQKDSVSNRQYYICYGSQTIASFNGRETVFEEKSKTSKMKKIRRFLKKLRK